MKALERQKAINLRLQGRSVKQIERELQVSRGSVSRWVRNVPLSDEQKHQLRINRITSSGQMRGAQENKRRALIRHEEARNRGFAEARTDDLLRVVAALYWGEGSKTNRQVCIANCDPNLLRIFGTWLIRSGQEDKLDFRVQYYPDNKIDEYTVKAWWLKQLPFLNETHVRKFTKLTVNRASQRKHLGKQLHGTASLCVNSTALLYYIFGAIDYLKSMVGTVGLEPTTATM
jgi:hypothetical protein